MSKLKKLKVLVMSQTNAEEYSSSKHTETSAMISITSVNDKEANVHESMSNGIVDILKLKFDDTDKLDEFNFGMSDIHAMEVCSFVSKYKNEVDRIIVHCGAGQSRSAGVAAAILKHLYNDDSQIFNNKRYTPNMRCYRLVLEKLIDWDMDFYSAWEFLNNHKVFGGCFQDCYDIEVVKINPNTNEVDLENSRNNTKTQVWIECGPWAPDCRTYNEDLDCGGDTFEEAIIALALLVRAQYGN